MLVREVGFDLPSEEEAGGATFEVEGLGGDMGVDTAEEDVLVFFLSDLEVGSLGLIPLGGPNLRGDVDCGRSVKRAEGSPKTGDAALGFGGRDAENGTALDNGTGVALGDLAD